MQLLSLTHGSEVIQNWFLKVRLSLCLHNCNSIGSLMDFSWHSPTLLSGYHGWLLSFTIQGNQETEIFIDLHCKTALVLDCCNGALLLSPTASKVSLCVRNKTGKYSILVWIDSSLQEPTETYRNLQDPSQNEHSDTQNTVLFDLDFCMGLSRLLILGPYCL